ncbi:hypothetical protein GC176_16320 [bacterium]|nr:hypothetical protein [bacterium]
MLVLTRKQSERILIGESVVLKVVGISGHRVRLAIDAPPDVRIVRGELVVTAPISKTADKVTNRCEIPRVPLAH